MKRRASPQLELLKRLYDYDPKTGVFTHKINRPRCRKGCVAGGTTNGYAIIAVLGIHYYAHRIAWYYTYGEWPEEIDHKDGNPLNNSIGNLRIATRIQNTGNSNGWGAHKRSGLPRGVYHYPGNQNRFVAQTRKKHLGSFWTVEEAEKAYKKAARQYFGEFAK